MLNQPNSSVCFRFLKAKLQFKPIKKFHLYCQPQTYMYARMCIAYDVGFAESRRQPRGQQKGSMWGVRYRVEARTCWRAFILRETAAHFWLFTSILRFCLIPQFISCPHRTRISANCLVTHAPVYEKRRKRMHHQIISQHVHRFRRQRATCFANGFGPTAAGLASSWRFSLEFLSFVKFMTSSTKRTRKFYVEQRWHMWDLIFLIFVFW